MKKHSLLSAYTVKFAIKIVVILISGYIFYFQFLHHDVHVHINPEQFEHHEHHQKSDSDSHKRPSDWGWMQRVFPHGNADKMAVVEAIQQAQDMRTAARKSPSDYFASTLRSASWTFSGPANIGGRISDIEYNPVDPSIVYAGASTGGVFKSLDGGYTWLPIFDEQAILSVGDIAVDPQNPDIVYVGTGEANGGHNNFPGGGVFKTEDGGATWQLIGLERTVSIGRIVIDPFNTDKIFVAAAGSYFGPDQDRGLYRSLNGGFTWEKSLFVTDSTGAIDVIMDPDNPDILLVAMWERVRGPHKSHLYGYTSGIYRSTNGGDSWTLLGAANGLPEDEEYIGRIGLALCQTQPEIMYALYTDYSPSGGYSYGALYQSVNSGNIWFPVDPDNELAAGFAGFSWYFGNVRVHPKDPMKVYVLDVSLMRTDDGGDTWPINYGYGSVFPDLHVDHHALAFHPFHPDTIIDGNDGGINISLDAGDTWTKVELLPVTQFYEITIDQTNPFRLYGGTQDNGTLRTLTGNIDDWENILGGDGFFVIVDPENPNIIYAESQFGNLYKSTNTGQSFRWARSGIDGNEPTNWSTPVVMDPQNNSVLYYGTNRVYRTEDGAENWYRISPDLTKNLSYSRLGTVTTIAVAPTNSDVIYAGTDDGNVWVTNNLGGNWQNITNGLPFRWVTRIAVDPADDSTAYVTFSGLKWKSPQPHVFRTTDMGNLWEDISSNLPDAPVNTIMVDPIYSNALFVGTDVGCFFTTDFGQNWDVLGQGLPVVPAYSMDIHNETRTLVVGTHGRSMYSINLGAVVSVEQASFETNITDQGVLLNWSTKTECNNHGFYVERKSEYSDFRQIGFVKGSGTVTTTRHYSFFDPISEPGVYFYRLKQIDFDGTFEYTKEYPVQIGAPQQFALHQNYPNPFNSSTVISFQLPQQCHIELNIYNTLGQRVRQLAAIDKQAGSYYITWNATNDNGYQVPTGIYVVELKTPVFKEMKRVLYLK